MCFFKPPQCYGLPYAVTMKSRHRCPPPRARQGSTRALGRIEQEGQWMVRPLVAGLLRILNVQGMLRRRRILPSQSPSSSVTEPGRRARCRFPGCRHSLGSLGSWLKRREQRRRRCNSWWLKKRASVFSGYRVLGAQMFAILHLTLTLNVFFFLFLARLF